MSDFADETQEQIEARVAATRARLNQTLDEIEDKFNVGKRAKELAGRAQASFEENRTPWIVGAAAVAAGVIGLIVWAVASSGDDD